MISPKKRIVYLSWAGIVLTIVFTFFMLIYGPITMIAYQPSLDSTIDQMTDIRELNEYSHRLVYFLKFALDASAFFTKIALAFHICIAALLIACIRSASKLE